MQKKTVEAFFLFTAQLWWKRRFWCFSDDGGQVRKVKFKTASPSVSSSMSSPVCSWALWRHALRRPGVGRCVGGVRVVGGWLWRVFAVPFGSPPSLPPNNPLPCSQGKPLNARAIHRRVRPRSPAFHALAANEVSKSRSGVTGVWPTLETLSGGAKAALWLKSLLTSNQRTMCSSLKSGGNCDAAFDLKSDLWICSCLW